MRNLQVDGRTGWAPLSLMVMAVLLAGCSRGPAGYDLTSFDPSSASAKALEMYDLDKDGFVAGEELEKAPGLNAALATLDANKDGKVSGEEIVNRVRAWNEMKMGVINISCEVTLDGAPLTDATVTFDPVEFQGGGVKTAVGVTSVLGLANPVIPKENRPSPDSPPGIQPGIYMVRISKMVDGKESIPPQYNTDTTLGQQVSQDDPALLSKKINFRLSSK